MGWMTCCQCKSNDEKIIELDFSRCGISEVPNEVYANSPTLEVLHLEGNKLKDLSPQLFQCIDLRYLNVSDNEIRAIPPLISKLTNLQVLIFSKNVLDGVHQNLDKLSKLTMLDLSMNDLGKVPEAIMSLINLQQLCLNDTGIDFVPANIGRLSNLRILELRDNNLSELPKSIRRLTNLQRLDVSDNNLTNLTEVCESHGNLTELWINGNNISELSVSITHLKKINDFDASYNNLESVPKEIGHWTKITNLILSFNNLVSLPKAVGNLRNLQVLKLESNFLEELPSTICKLVNLEELNLQNNSLIKVPSGIGHLRKLATLILSDNKLQQLPLEIGSCCELSILNVHNNHLEKLPDEVGHLQNLTTLGLIGNRLSYLPITISKLQNLKALWLTPNQTQPLIHLQNEQLPDGQVVLTSVVFPQTPLREPPPAQLPMGNQNCHITFNTERNDSEVTDAQISLSRTPTPHHKELKRLREVLRNSHIPGKRPLNISEIKEAKVTNISGDLTVSENSLNGRESTEIPENLSDITREINKTPPKQPPPYHIAAVYSKNAHLFTQNQTVSPPSPMDQPKQFSQKQPANIHMPTPKLPSNRSHIPVLQIADANNGYKDVNMMCEDDLNQSKQLVKWPFGKHKVCQVLEVEIPQSFTPKNIRIVGQSNGLFIDYVDPQSEVFQKVCIGDKILAIDEIDYTIMEPVIAYQDACQRMSNLKTVTVSRNPPL
ncbi:leucine-rich repeat-containing protein 1 isoform X1 [Diorhabda carinulata]|uniref:leucine-rich repeat-containing protein 1 isoform X1 n=1 Tax=Diorhabda carinulata TaxID=1163345 RepID=UPI0025A10DEB|nr:leucine-rich repeat-containing protein 1 isoform X1 [Diorhabda carinulata]XP_057655764.1 leucine-rich repeat-containing protein 1 isoform X1 [Diorhabda carinulata]